MKRSALLLAAVLAFAAGPALAQAFPAKPVTIVVPYAPGGGTDTVARTLAAALSTLWSQPVVVENTAGADGAIGTQRVLRAPADGYTVLMQVNQMILHKGMGGGSMVDDFRLISKIQHSPLSFVVPAGLPVKTIGEFLAWCKAKPTECSWASSTRYGNLIGRQLLSEGGVTEAIPVSYKGTAPMMNDLVGSHVKLALPAVPTALPLHRGGQVRILAVGSPKRFPALPDVPTMIEAGYPAVQGDSWYGLMVSRDTPDAIFNRIYESVRTVSKDPRVLTSIEAAGGVAIFGSPEEFRSDVKRELEYLNPIAARHPVQQQ